jgi:hypothetical protein
MTIESRNNLNYNKSNPITTIITITTITIITTLPIRDLRIVKYSTTTPTPR